MTPQAKKGAFKEAVLDETLNKFIDYLQEGTVRKLTYDEKIKNVSDSLVYKNSSDPELLLSAENINNIFNGLGLDKVFAFDEFTQKTYQVRKLPWSTEEIVKLKEFNELIFTELSYELNLKFEFSKKSLLRDAIVVHAKKNSINTVRDFIKTEVWDGVKRVESVFIDYLGVNDDEYGRAATSLFFRGAVGRAFHPGCKYDYMHILAGPQGKRKSTLIHKLASDWSSIGPPSFDAKIGGEYVKSSWIVEIDELIALKNSSSEETKAFITRLFDEYRPAYGKLVERFPRKCVLIGTTNEYMFLRDKTGNRRYLPLTCENKPNKEFNELTDYEVAQIWAEAYEMYQSNSNLDLDEDIKAKAEKIRENHIYYDPLEGKIEEYLNMPRPDNWKDLLPQERYDKFKNYLSLEENQVWKGSEVVEISPIEIHTEALGKIEKQITSYESKSIGQALLNLGWTLSKQNRKRLKHYGQQKLYVKIKKNENHEPQE